MVAPAYTNGPWNFDANNDCSETATLDSKRHALWQTKESLVGFSAWSVVASSDSSTVKQIGDASPDLWTAWSDVVFGVGAHSWCILENSVTGEQLCLDAFSSNTQRVVVAYSPDGVYATDGTTSARPTATYELELATDSYDALGSASLDGIIVHAMMSNDSTCTRFVWHQKASTSYGDFVIILENLVNTPSQWSSTYKRGVYLHSNSVVLGTTNITKSPLLANWDNQMRVYMVDATPFAGWLLVWPTAECFGDFDTANAALPLMKQTDYQSLMGGYMISKIGIWRSGTSRSGSMGRLQDLYWANHSHDTYQTFGNPSGLKRWVKIGCLMMPWDGSEPLEVT